MIYTGYFGSDIPVLRRQIDTRFRRVCMYYRSDHLELHPFAADQVIRPALVFKQRIAGPVREKGVRVG